MRIPAPLGRTAVPLLLAALLASCIGDGTTLGPDGVPLGPPVVAVTPSEFALSMIEATNASLEITITNEGGLPLRVDGVVSTSPLLVPDFAGPRDVASGATLGVRADLTAPEAVLSPLEAALEVRTNDPETPIVSVPVRLVATVGPQPVIGVSVDSLTVRVAPEGADARTFTIRNTGTGDLEVSSIAGTAAFLAPGIDNAVVAVGDSVDVVMTADAAGLAVGSHLAAIEIASNDEDAPLVSIPVLLSIETPFPAVFSAIQDSVFSPFCSASNGCHTIETVAGELILQPGSSYGSLVGVKSWEVGGLYRVVPGDADNSYLYIKIKPGAPDPRRVGLPMPPVPPMLPDSFAEVVRLWIEEGAPAN
ncbi:hypothetical protein K8I85_19465 [bacterium]|nr:hypothetical protein [bacterium]